MKGTMYPTERVYKEFTISDSMIDRSPALLNPIVDDDAVMD
jgi:hypothetical protein